MLRRCISLVVSIIAAGALLALMPDSAFAGVTTTCTAGTYQGTGEDQLTNGRLEASFCTYGDVSGATMAQVHVQYAKTYGGPISLRFGWEWTDGTGHSIGTQHWTSASNLIPITAGETKTRTFTYATPGLYPPSAQRGGCYRGLLWASGYNYSTRIVCTND
ncbi:hypothetical protein GCM10028772_13550 [Nocardioides ultimimeridianus]